MKLPRLSLPAWPAKIGWRDQLVGVALAIVYVAWLLSTARSIGFMRDESFYFDAATDYARWFQAFADSPGKASEKGFVDSVWHVNSEHPSLMKSLFALSWMFLHEKWHVFTDASTAFRFPGMVMGGLGLWLTYLFGARAFSRRAGIVAAVLLALMPHVFFHAHLACFDVGIMTMWTLAIYTYWRSLEKGAWGWILLAGIVFGLTLETKHNAWVLPGVYLTHAVIYSWRRLGRWLPFGFLPVPASLFSIALLGPLVFVLLWPWMWNDTLARVAGWFTFHTQHNFYNMEFLGQNYFAAPSPRGYLPVMVLATVPAVTLLLFAVGAVDRALLLARRFFRWLESFRVVGWTERKLGWKRPEASALPELPRDPRETNVLLFLGIGFAIFPWFLERTPIFGGTKHWMPAYPFLAIFAGHGFDLVSAALGRVFADKKRLVRLGAQAALIIAVVAAPLAVTAHATPFGLGSYTPLVGGEQGAASLGLNRQFWGYTTQDANEYLTANARRGARVFIHDTTMQAWNEMQREGRMRPDLVAVGSPSEADFALVQYELHMTEVEYSIWVAFGTTAPDHVVTYDGVPMLIIYKRPGAR